MSERRNPSIDSSVRRMQSDPSTAEYEIKFLLGVEAYEYGSTLETKRQLVRALQSIGIPESMRDEVELFILYLNRYERSTGIFDKTCITYDNGFFIGGIPLFDAAGRYVFQPDYKGVVVAQSGKRYEIACFPNSIEIKNYGRVEQMSGKPGYFKLKKEEGYAQAIVETESTDGSKRDPNIYFGRLLQYLTDTYPFAMGPITLFKADWRRGTNFDEYQKYSTLLQAQTKSIPNSPEAMQASLEELSPYLADTPFRNTDLTTHLEKLKNIELIRRQNKIAVGWDYALDQDTLRQEAMIELCAEIAAWKTATGRALHKRLGFSSVHTHPILLFSRDIQTALEREKRIQSLPAL